MKERQIHPLGPIYEKGSKILILGSFPSVQSPQGSFYYHNPRNRFWKVLSAVFACPEPRTLEEKRWMLHQTHVALWDVVDSCKIEGSSDTSICDIVPTDLRPLLHNTAIRKIFCNGGKAWTLYQRFQLSVTRIEAVKLPSTSPANAGYRLPDLISAWATVKGAS